MITSCLAGIIQAVSDPLKVNLLSHAGGGPTVVIYNAGRPTGEVS